MPSNRFSLPLVIGVWILTLAGCEKRNQSQSGTGEDLPAKTNEGAHPPNPGDDWLIIQGNNKAIENRDKEVKFALDRRV